MTPSQYAEKIMAVLNGADNNTAKSALRIAEVLHEHKVNAEAGVSLAQLSEQYYTAYGQSPERT